jgi:hypothetical protein
MRIPLTATTVIQLLVWALAVLQFLLGPESPIPDHWRPWIVMAAGIVSITLHVVAGSHNPDGGPVSLPYVPGSPRVISAGKAAYEAYREQSGGFSPRTGRPLPPWEALPEAVQAAWRAGGMAAKAANEPQSE